MDTIGKTVLFFLLFLSIASWYFIFIKCLTNWLEARRAKSFVDQFWQENSIESLSASLHKTKSNNVFANLAVEGLDTLCNVSSHGVQKLTATGGMSEFITRALRNSID